MGDDGGNRWNEYEPVGIVHWASLARCLVLFSLCVYFVLRFIIHTCGLPFVSTLLPIKKERNNQKICIRLFTIHALPLLCVPATQPASVA